MLKKNENVVIRDVHGSTFLIDISDNYSGDKCALYEINETGKFLWNNVETYNSIEALTDLLQQEIIDEVPYEILLNDVTDFIADLEAKQFVLEVAIDG